jgi:L-seryl-tRNA(Ser) seleniumtransferase
MSIDRFGNAFAPGLPYARGTILARTEDDLRKVERAGRLIERRVRQHGPEGIFNFTGLEHGLPLQPEDLPFAHDELAPAIYGDRLRDLALKHLGGSPDRHEAVLFNRLTGATLATFLTLLEPDDVVVGVSPAYSHPTVVRAAAQARARFVDATGRQAFERAMPREPRVKLVALTRLSVTYDLLPAEDVRAIVALAHDRGALVYADDAGGARVAPAMFGHPEMLETGVDLGATGLDKYGTVGPRLGLLAGDRGLATRIRARAFEFGLEARPLFYPAVVRTLEGYSPGRVRALVEATKQVAAALRSRLGGLVQETPVIARLGAEDLLQAAMERGGVSRPPIVPYEAAAALAMLMLEDHGILLVHFVGMPPGNADLLIKFMPPETLARLGGPEVFARAVEASLERLGRVIQEPAAVRRLLLGEG